MQVGAWGPGPVENDDAMDFLLGLGDVPAQDRADQVRAALVLADGYVEAPEGFRAVAAAGLVAAASGMSTEESEDVAG